MAPSESQYKEWFSRAFLQATSAKAGVGLDFVGNDFWGVDATLSLDGDAVDVQLKATASLTRDADGHPRFDLDVPTYEKLRVPNRHAYAYLIVVEVPELRAEWVVHEPARFILAREAYFLLLTGQPPTSNSSTVRLTLPAENVLTAEAIGGIMLHSRLSRRALGS